MALQSNIAVGFDEGRLQFAVTRVGLLVRPAVHALLHAETDRLVPNALGVHILSLAALQFKTATAVPRARHELVAVFVAQLVLLKATHVTAAAAVADQASQAFCDFGTFLRVALSADFVLR